MNTSGSGTFLQILKFPLLSTSIGHANRFDFFCFSVYCCADLCDSTLAGNVVALCMNCKGTKKCQHPEIPRSLALFLDLQNSSC